jgi:cytochrome c553
MACSTQVFAEPVEAAENWRKHCLRCHAADGSGSTRIGQRLNIKNYTDPAVQASLCDATILAVIRDGLRDEGGKDIHAAYADKLSAEEIQALLVYIRAMQKE